MSTTVAVPLWLAILIAVLAAFALLDRLLVPSARWFLRSRANKVLDEVGTPPEDPDPAVPAVQPARADRSARL